MNDGPRVPGTLLARDTVRWHPALPAGTALIVGVAAAILVFHALKDDENRHLVGEFNQLAGERTEAVRRSFQDVFDAVLALRSFHGVSTDMGREEFAVYATPLLRERPGIRALEWAPRVPARRRAFVEREARFDGYPEFTFTQLEPDGKLKPCGSEDSYYPVFYVEPYGGNESALGFDLASEPVRRRALMQARDTGHAVSTTPIALLQDEGTKGCLVAAPVYGHPGAPASVDERREELRGFVVGVVTSGAMLETALGTFSPEGVEIAISDVTAPDSEVSLGRWKPGLGRVNLAEERASSPATTDFVRVSLLDLGDRSWKITASATPDFFHDTGSPMPGVVLIGLLAFTALVAFYLYRTSERTDKLAESESRYRTLVEHAPESIVILDMDTGVFVDANENALNLLSLTREELGRYGPADLSPEFQPDGSLSRDVAAARIGEALAGGAPSFEWTHRSLDGREILCEVRLVRLPAGRRNLIRGSMTDITARRQGEKERAALERRLAEARKLESLGMLTGGIAHDFNNLLTPILGRVDLALEEMPEGSPGRSHLQDIRTSAERAGELITQLLAFTGQASVIPTAVRLNEVVEEMIRLYGVSIPGVEIRLDLDPADPTVRGDARQLRQVVLNLITNAADAVGEAGTIRIATGVVAPGSQLQAGDSGNRDPGPRILLSVADTGPGIAPEVLDRIFDPFFSTKKQGRGLGLATIQGIVKSHGGEVVVRTEPGRGATFEVLLPAAPAEAVVPSEPGRGIPISHGAEQATILVADDEVRVRSLVRAILEREGYRTLEAGSGPEALVALENGAKDARLALLDLTMPGLSGTDLLERVHRLHPELPVVVMSGFGGKAALAAVADLGFSEFLAKPFDPGQLLEAVRRALEPV